MAARVRKDGTIVCAAKHPAMEGDLYLDDLIQSLLIGLGVTVTEDGGGVWTVADPREWSPKPPQNVDIWKEEIARLESELEAQSYMGNSVQHWYVKAKAYGDMVHGVNPILGALEGEATRDAAKRVVAELAAERKRRDEAETLSTKRGGYATEFRKQIHRLRAEVRAVSRGLGGIRAQVDPGELGEDTRQIMLLRKAWAADIREQTERLTQMAGDLT